jgi:hypothetical protein
LADDHTFAEGHELDPETSRKVPNEAIGRRLSQDEAAELLDHLVALDASCSFCSSPRHVIPGQTWRLALSTKSVNCQNKPYRVDP